MENENKLKNAFSEALAVEIETITDELKYQSIPQWDSISHMVLVSAIEETFEISINTDEIIDLSSFFKAKEILSKKGINF